MNFKRLIVFIALLGILSFGLWLPAEAAPNPQQQIPTPTAGADGRIIYIVKPGDSCFVVAALHSMSVDQLRQLNSRLDENCTLVEGQELLIGFVSQATPTSAVAATPGTATVTPTPISGTTEVCVLLFEDTNGNAIREETEPAVQGGAISVTEINGEYSASLETIIPADPEAYQGMCFSNVPEGTYNITVGVPSNYNPTMALNYSLDVKAGDRAFANFGVQSKEEGLGTAPEEDTGGDSQSTILGIVGGLLLLGGAGLGYYAWRTSKPESKLSGGGVLKK